VFIVTNEVEFRHIITWDCISPQNQLADCNLPPLKRVICTHDQTADQGGKYSFVCGHTVPSLRTVCPYWTDVVANELPSSHIVGLKKHDTGPSMGLYRCLALVKCLPLPFLSFFSIKTCHMGADAQVVAGEMRLGGPWRWCLYKAIPVLSRDCISVVNQPQFTEFNRMQCVSSFADIMATRRTAMDSSMKESFMVVR
jgi:hypothetical protein